VQDKCRGTSKKIEDRILKQQRKEDFKVVKRPSKPRPKPFRDPPKYITRECYFTADPHAKALTGKHFEAQTVGDWVAYKGPRLTMSYRGKSMGRWVGIVEWYAKLNGHTIRTKGNQLLIDGRSFPLQNGGKKSWGKTSVTWQNNKVSLKTLGEESDIFYYGSFWNLFVRSTRCLKKIKGLCNQQWVASKAFDHPQAAKRPHLPRKPCPNRKDHEKFCRAHTKNPYHFKECVSDRCRGTSKRIEGKILKQERQEKNKRPIRRD
jgi:hypothetical protein